jgi:GTP-binding protein
MLIDHCTIFVRSGKGGNGCVSLCREKYRPKGGPNGGDGGCGGDVVLVGDQSVSTLLSLTPRPHYRAKNGMPGLGSSMNGAAADHTLIAVPLGTIAVDRETGETLVEITTHGEQVIVAKGGVGGYGNEHFKSSTNQTPREAMPGGDWQERTLDLELKLLADVGLVGLPNAGKSTLLSAVSAARPKVADYPFTTKSPHLGIAELPGERRLVIADLPGLIEGAAGGAGMGHDFLKHVERNAVILHVLDAMPIDGTNPVDNWKLIRGELDAFGDVLTDKPEIIMLNKCDLIDEDTTQEIVAALKSAGGTPVLAASGVTGQGVDRVLEAIWLMVSGVEETIETGGWNR